MRKFIDIITESEDYRGQHSAPSAQGDAALYDLTLNGIYDMGVYGPKGYSEYAHDAVDGFYMAMSCRGHPNRPVKIYRSVPKDLVRPKITPGDWVTTTRRYATDHGRANLNNNFKIITKTVFARDLYTEGNSLDEWGYDPQPGIYGEAEDAIKRKFGMKTRSEVRDARMAKMMARYGVNTPEEALAAQQAVFDKENKERRERLIKLGVNVPQD